MLKAINKSPIPIPATANPVVFMTTILIPSLNNYPSTWPLTEHSVLLWNRRGRNHPIAREGFDQVGNRRGGARFDQEGMRAQLVGAVEAPPFPVAAHHENQH